MLPAYWKATGKITSQLVTNKNHKFMSDNNTNNGQSCPNQKPQAQQAAPAGQAPKGKKNKGARK